MPEFPVDKRLADLRDSLRPEWAWSRAIDLPGVRAEQPKSLSVRHFSHVPGRSATISYVADYEDGTPLAPLHFSVHLRRNRPPEVSVFPNDRHLPGLRRIADSTTGLDLINRHVFEIPRRGLHVSVVRYRPFNRAVLRHRSGANRFYVRVVRPNAVRRFVFSLELIAQSGFAAPRIAGTWGEGGVIWVSEVPGQNLRRLIRSGKLPDPNPLLDGLASIWSIPVRGAYPELRPFRLAGSYERAYRTFEFALRDVAEERRVLADAVAATADFVDRWGPSSVAHNDFYDDQMLALADGRIALVDVEDAGLGDPLLDVGNLLAHANWAARFQSGPRGEAHRRFYEQFREAALARFGWRESELAMREAVSLFRVCTNAIRHPRPDWRERTVSGLRLVSQLAA